MAGRTTYADVKIRATADTKALKAVQADIAKAAAEVAKSRAAFGSAADTMARYEKAMLSAAAADRLSAAESRELRDTYALARDRASELAAAVQKNVGVLAALTAQEKANIAAAQQRTAIASAFSALAAKQAANSEAYRTKLIAEAAAERESAAAKQVQFAATQNAMRASVAEVARRAMGTASVQAGTGAYNAQVAALGNLNRATLEVTSGETKIGAAVDATTKKIERQTNAWTKLVHAGSKDFDVPLPAGMQTNGQGKMFAGAAGRGGGKMFGGEAGEIEAFGLKGYKLVNLGYQVNDVISGLAMGQAPLQIVAQQAGQFVQIWPQLLVGLTKSLPLFGTLAALLAPVVVNMVRMNREAASTRQFTSELVLLADGSLYSAQNLAAFTEAVIKTGVATEDARQVISNFAKEGVREDRFVELAAAAEALAKVTGEKVPDAAKKLSAAFAGGFEGLRDLDKQMNIFTATELDSIRTMFAAGNAAQAQEFAFDALQAKLAQAPSTGPWTDAMTEVKNAWEGVLSLFSDSAVSAVVEFVFTQIAHAATGAAAAIRDATGALDKLFGRTDAERLTQLQANRGDVLSQISNVTGQIVKGFGGPSAVAELQALNQELRDIDASIALIQGKMNAAPPGGPSAGLTEAQLEELSKGYADFRAELEESNKARADETIDIGKTNRQLEADVEVRKKLNEAIKKNYNLVSGFAASWAKEEARIRASVNAKHDAAEAQDALDKALDLTKSLVDENSTAQEKYAQKIKDSEAAIATLVLKFGVLDPKVQAAVEALNRFKAAFDVRSILVDRISGFQQEADLAALTVRDRYIENKLLETRNALQEEANRLGVKYNGLTEDQIRMLREQAGLSFDRQAGAELVASGLSGVVDKIIGIESGGNASAKNPNSSATGLGQFTEETWMRMLRKYFPELSGRSDALQLREDPVLSREMVALLVKENAGFLKTAGYQVNEASLYLSHFLGAGGAASVIGANPQTPVSSVLGSDQIAANQSILGGKTAGEVIAWAQQKMGISEQEAAVNSRLLEIDTERAETARDYNEGYRQRVADQQAELAAITQTGRQAAITAALRQEELAATEAGLVLTQQQRDEITRSTGALYDRQNVEEAVNAILETRGLLLDRLAIAQVTGDQGAVASIKSEIAATDSALNAAIEKAIAFWRAMGGPNADNAILKLQNMKLEIEVVAREALFTAEDINNSLADGGASAFDTFAESVANGENAIESFRDAFLSFASDFLLQIGKMIVQQALLNALGAGVDGGGGAGGIISQALNAIVKHDGGLLTSGPTRMVPSSIFANATRYHGGGGPYLKPGEKPAILMEDEEVLTRSDPRHALNGGGSGGSVKVINVLDPGDIVEAGLATVKGERAILNHVTSRKSKFKGVLGS